MFDGNKLLQAGYKPGEAYEEIENRREAVGLDRRYADITSFRRNLYRHRKKKQNKIV